ncbi:hypothetical protein JB92DRAFT_2960731, partial [Gautieria morchelliformis]
MDIAELLNPAAESHMFEGTDKDIYQSVITMTIVMTLMATYPSNAPTHNEALQAVLVLGKYVRDIDDPFAHKLEMMLGSFGQRTRAAGMKTLKDNKLNYLTIVLFSRCRTANPNPKSLRYPILPHNTYSKAYPEG